MLVTHDVHEAVALADRIVVLEAGRVTLNLPVLLPRPHARGTSPGFSTLVSKVLTHLMADHTAKERRDETHPPHDSVEPGRDLRRRGDGVPA